MHPFIVNFLSCAYKFAESSGSDFHVVFFELHQGYVLSMADKDVAIRIDEHHTLDSFRERDFSNQLLVFRPYFDYALNVWSGEFSWVGVDVYARKRVIMVVCFAYIKSNQSEFAFSLLVLLQLLDLSASEFVLIRSNSSLDLTVTILILRFNVCDPEQFAISWFERQYNLAFMDGNVEHRPESFYLVVFLHSVFLEFA